MDIINTTDKGKVTYQSYKPQPASDIFQDYCIKTAHTWLYAGHYTNVHSQTTEGAIKLSYTQTQIESCPGQ